jgi:hypothetical protein
LITLVAIDFGRIFLGWVSINNAARVGANFAALHPNDWNSGGGPAEYDTLMAQNLGAINCTPNPNPPADPVFGPTKDPGELVQVNLSCDFSVITPIISSIVGTVVTLSSSASFPISSGCLAACPSGPPAPPPPPPADNCRAVPDVVGLSVAGARLAWAAAGFVATQFVPATGDDTRTVASASVAEAPNTEGCIGVKKFFDSTMTVTLAPLQTPPPTPTCIYVPNMRGITVADARSAWTDAGFSGAFLPTANDTKRVLDQVTLPASSPGDCMEPDTSVTVTYGDPLPNPPPAPCKVPSFVNTSSSAATTTWTGAGFGAANISFKPSNGNTFTIKSQTLVGGTYVSCGASIEVSKTP